MEITRVWHSTAGIFSLAGAAMQTRVTVAVMFTLAEWRGSGAANLRVLCLCSAPLR